MTSRDSSSESADSQWSHQDPPEPKKEPKSGLGTRIKNGWARLELDLPTVILMMKGAVPPTIALAAYQADSFASHFNTVGYLVAIVSVLGFAIMPRAKFIQMMVLDVLAVCTASAVALLMMYSSVKAREHTDPSSIPSSGSSSIATNGSGGITATPYNSSASAVSGVWLFFEIYLVHSFRAKYQQFQFPVIIFSIVANVTFVYAPRLPTMAASISMVKKLLEACLTGLAFSTGTCLFVFPMTSRKVVFKEMAGYIGGLRAALNAHTDYFGTLERDDMFGRAETYDSHVEKITEKGKVYSPEAEAIRAAVRKLTDLHAKLHADLTFAKREMAIGNLGPDDLQAIFRHLRQIMIPIVGLSFVVDIFQRLSDYNKWNQPIDPMGAEPPDMIRHRVVQEWNDIMRAVHDPFESLIHTIDEGLQHALFTLKLANPPKKPATNSADGSADVEAGVGPGDKQFAAHFERKLREFKVAKKIALRTWSEEKGIKLPADFFERPSSAHINVDDVPKDEYGIGRDRSRRQLYLFLYMEQLLNSAGHVVLEFVRFADERVESGKLSRKHLIIPGWKRVRKWVLSVFKADDSHEDDNMGDMHTQNNILQLGEAYKHRRDPEHLPSDTAFQKFGDKIRVIPSLLRSSESAYGFRVACATMTIAVVAFIHDTQTFFIKQRFVWAMVMVNLSMSPTSGQSIFGFVLRIFGTVLAMILSFLCWFIPGTKTPGIIVFFFIFVSIMFYIPIKMFRFRIIGIITIISTSMIVGYELQVRKVGEHVATSNGQPYYPIHLLAPYRLATVTGGIAVSFFWTFFPYPISEHSVLRQSLGASLYLLANYYSIIHETVNARMRGDEGDIALKTSAGRRLLKARNKVFSKQMLMLTGLRTYSEFLKWEVPIGGRFPKKQYDSIISCIESYLSLLGYASDTLLQLGDDGDDSNTVWIHDFRRLVASARITTHEITSVLCLLSASITNRQPLPPYLKTPRPYSFSKRLEALDKDILSLRHIAEPGFATFAVLQISTRCIVGDVDRLMRDVKTLVGELDFSFHAVSTAQSVKSSADVSRLSRATDRDKLE
ncbi:MFS transporter [Aspergillus steynii IBT 23096]|uniref:MFS transporter n=1 Tax=Aspergillus steynii IBT 23096 TaxID=1392250 RepID=A0A2I2G8B2_9EURO|nr:MFS transporter [Aspergillus steynii IBT 23096]PLB49083.1 MFS transporter [Aspergillus steynii IBT 23096]